jgi:hypothetical protein
MNTKHNIVIMVLASYSARKGNDNCIFYFILAVVIVRGLTGLGNTYVARSGDEKYIVH